MRNPDKESKKAPGNVKTFSADEEKRKKRGKAMFVATVVSVGLCLFFLIFGGGENSSESGYYEGINTETPQTGDVRIGRTKRENVDIASDFERRNRNREKNASSSFDWFDKEGKKVDAPAEENYKSSRSSDERKLQEALARADALASGAATAAPAKSHSYTAASSSSGVSSSQSSEPSESERYFAKKKEELDRRTEEQLRKIEEMKNPKPKETATVAEKKKNIPVAEVEGQERQKGFYGIEGSSSSKGSAIRAVVHGEHVNLRSGATVKMRLLDNIRIGEYRVPQNTFIYGKLSFSKGRAQIFVENINYNNNIIPFQGVIYDKDGFEGIYVPDNIVDETARKAGGAAVNSVDVNISSPSSIVNSGVNAVTGAIKSAVSGSVKEEKISISTNYLLTIKQQR
jgi:hypothetical protein